MGRRGRKVQYAHVALCSCTRDAPAWEEAPTEEGTSSASAWTAAREEEAREAAEWDEACRRDTAARVLQRVARRRGLLSEYVVL